MAEIRFQSSFQLKREKLHSNPYLAIQSRQKNILANRLTCLINKIPLDWLNHNKIKYKLLRKQQFLPNTCYFVKFQVSLLYINTKIFDVFFHLSVFITCLKEIKPSKSKKKTFFKSCQFHSS